MIGIEEENGFQQYDGTGIPDNKLDSTSTNSVQNKVITGEINEIKANVPFKFGVDANGNYGYIKDGADTVTPFKKDPTFTRQDSLMNIDNTGIYVKDTSVTKGKYIVITGIYNADTNTTYVGRNVDVTIQNGAGALNNIAKGSASNGGTWYAMVEVDVVDITSATATIRQRAIPQDGAQRTFWKEMIVIRVSN